MQPIYAKWLAIGVLLSLLLNALFLIAAVRLNRQFELFAELTPLSIWLFVSFVFTQNLLLVPGLYWYDKRQSKQPHKERIPERILHILALCGGGFGALYGQRHLHHKSQKAMFKVTAWLGILAIVYVGYLAGKRLIN